MATNTPRCSSTLCSIFRCDANTTFILSATGSKEQMTKKRNREERNGVGTSQQVHIALFQMHAKLKGSHTFASMRLRGRNVCITNEELDHY